MKKLKLNGFAFIIIDWNKQFNGVATITALLLTSVRDFFLFASSSFSVISQFSIFIRVQLGLFFFFRKKIKWGNIFFLNGTIKT